MKTTFVNKKLVIDKLGGGFSPLPRLSGAEALDYSLPNAAFPPGNFAGFPPSIRFTLPGMTEQVREHLRLLSIFHYVVGGIGYAVSLIPCIHLAIGIFFLVAPPETFLGPEVKAPDGEVMRPGSPEVFPAKLMGTIFTSVASVIILGGFIVSTMIVIAGKRLAAHRSHTFCLVVAGIECLFMPFGTILGVFTILALLKTEARQLFGLPPVGGA